MIESNYEPDIYTGNGVATTFAYGNKITAASQLVVTLYTIADGTEEVLVLDTDYSVSGVGDDSGGTVTYPISGDPMEDTHKLIIERSTPVLQSTDFEEQGGFHASTHEDAFDKLTAILQEKQNDGNRSPKFSVASGLTDVVLPAPEAGKYLRGNADEDGYENAEMVSTGEAVVSDATPAALTGSDTGAAGTSEDLSRADHRHGMPLSALLNWTGIHTHTKVQKWAKGADVASAGALTLGDDGNYFDITGTTSITSIASKGVGTVVKLHFDGALILTHHSTDLVLPGGASITTAAGDEAEFVEYASGDWRCTSYVKASGLPVVASSADMAYANTRFKVGSFTRDLSTASGTQAITGLGFAPKAVLFFGVLDGLAASWGFSDGATDKGMLFRGSGGPIYGTGAIQFQLNTTPDQQYTSDVALDADGFTLTWVKQNSPTGTANIHYIAFR